MRPLQGYRLKDSLKRPEGLRGVVLRPERGGKPPEDNPLVEAFRLRRRCRRPGWRRWVTPVFRGPGVGVGMALAGFWLVFFVAPAAGLRQVRLVMGIGLFLIVSGVVWSYARRFGKSSGSGFLPRSMSALLLNAPVWKEAMVDVWMTGAGARCAFDAVYLEYRGDERRTGIAALFLIFLAGLVVYFWLRGFLFLPAAALTLSWAALVLTLAGVVDSAYGLAGVQKVRQKWKQDLEGPVRQAVHGIGRAVVILLAIIPAMFLFGILIRLFAWAVRSTPVSIRSLPFEYLLSAGLLAAAGLVWALRRPIAGYNEDRLESARREMEKNYDFYIRKLVLGDADAAPTRPMRGQR